MAGSAAELSGLGLPPALARQMGSLLLNSITAATTQTQAAGTSLTGTINVITVCANSSDAVTLPSLASLNYPMVIVSNQGAQTTQIFPASGQSVNGGTTDASVTLAAGKVGIFWGKTFKAAGDWVFMAGA